jgi:hypothetical protein
VIPLLLEISGTLSFDDADAAVSQGAAMAVLLEETVRVPLEEETLSLFLTFLSARPRLFLQFLMIPANRHTVRCPKPRS